MNPLPNIHDSSRHQDSFRGIIMKINSVLLLFVWICAVFLIMGTNDVESAVAPDTWNTSLGRRILAINSRKVRETQERTRRPIGYRSNRPNKNKPNLDNLSNYCCPFGK